MKAVKSLFLMICLFIAGALPNSLVTASEMNHSRADLQEIKKNTPLVLVHGIDLPGSVQNMHYSHASHASHASHYSHYSGY